MATKIKRGNISFNSRKGQKQPPQQGDIIFKRHPSPPPDVFSAFGSALFSQLIGVFKTSKRATTSFRFSPAPGGVWGAAPGWIARGPSDSGRPDVSRRRGGLVARRRTRAPAWPAHLGRAGAASGAPCWLLGASLGSAIAGPNKGVAREGLIRPSPFFVLPSAPSQAAWRRGDAAPNIMCLI